MRKPKPTKLYVKGDRSGRDVTVRLDRMVFEHCKMTSWSMSSTGAPPFPTRQVISVCFLTEKGTRIEVVGEHVDFRWEE